MIFELLITTVHCTVYSTSLSWAHGNFCISVLYNGFPMFIYGSFFKLLSSCMGSLRHMLLFFHTVNQLFELLRQLFFRRGLSLPSENVVSGVKGWEGGKLQICWGVLQISDVLFFIPRSHSLPLLSLQLPYLGWLRLLIYQSMTRENMQIIPT